MQCRHCRAPLHLTMVDLGAAPPSNSYITLERLNAPERWYPLRVLVCERCWLAQTEDFTEAQELFDEEYAYFSSYSSTWLAHAARYVEDISERLGLSAESLVMEVASNDGYLLKNFVARGVPCFGVEPTRSTAAAARAQGIEVVEDFFGERLARELSASRGRVDLALGNNVLAHVPDINDFVAGFRLLLKPAGVVTFEFPHLQALLEQAQFDTIYHEHYSYLSLHAVQSVLESQGLRLFDVESLTTHGGSLRVYAQRADVGTRVESERVRAVLRAERAAGLCEAAVYARFGRQVFEHKLRFLEALIAAKRAGKRIAAYGAAAKGNTLLNYAGVRADLVDYVVDRNPHKQGKLLPGSRIPVVAAFREPAPDVVLILPWNLRAEIMDELKVSLGGEVECWTYHGQVEQGA